MASVNYAEGNIASRAIPGVDINFLWFFFREIRVPGFAPDTLVLTRWATIGAPACRCSVGLTLRTIGEVTWPLKCRLPASARAVSVCGRHCNEVFMEKSMPPEPRICGLPAGTRCADGSCQTQISRCVAALMRPTRCAAACAVSRHATQIIYGVLRIDIIGTCIYA